MGFAGKDYFARHYDEQKLEWEKEAAWHRGWEAGYAHGSRDMRRAYGRDEVAETRPETESEGHQDEGVQDPLGDALCEDPKCGRQHVRITVASGPYIGNDWGC